MTGTPTPNLDLITLAHGNHPKREDGVCLLELAAWIADEPHTDRPACVCPVLAEFGRVWNDALPGYPRQRLKPYAARLVGTRSTPNVEVRRAWLACDWLVRTFAPAWLRAGGLNDDARRIETLPELTDTTTTDQTTPTFDRAKVNVHHVRGIHLSETSWLAAAAAAGTAARNASLSASPATANVDIGGHQARDIATITAFTLARRAISHLTTAQLDEIVETFDGSAFDLYDRMIATV